MSPVSPDAVPEKNTAGIKIESKEGGIVHEMKEAPDIEVIRINQDDPNT